ncbi:MAG: nucleoside-triphosphatase [Oscillospiraceae bacterium]|jgi:nucleoside-triphosphatase THEP1|nr:nucleoside-triphosphatase [Oscillospiraceae bacterium]
MKNIFLTGQKRVGKTTALNAFLAENAPDMPPAGFSTEWNAAHDCLQMTDLLTGKSAVIARMSGGKLTAYPDVFDSFGVSVLCAARGRPIVVMDELGRLEKSSPAFHAAVFDLLAEPGCRVVGVLQQASGQFTGKIAALPNVRVIDVTELNRNGIPAELKTAFLNLK